MKASAVSEDVSGVKAIIVNYLREIGDGGTFKSHDVELELPRWGYLRYKRAHNPGTYSRSFRELREKDVLKYFGIELTEMDSRKEKAWKVRLFT